MSSNNYFELSIDDDPRFDRVVPGNLRDYTDTMKIRAINHISREFENSRPLTRPKTEFIGHNTYITREVFVSSSNLIYEAIEMSCDKDLYSEIVEENIRREIILQRDNFNKANSRHPERK